MCTEYITHIKRVAYRFNLGRQDLITLIYCIYPTSLIFSRPWTTNQLEKWDFYQYDNPAPNRTTPQMTYLQSLELKFEGSNVPEYFEVSSKSSRPASARFIAVTGRPDKARSRKRITAAQSLSVSLGFPRLLFFELLLQESNGSLGCSTRHKNLRHALAQ